MRTLVVIASLVLATPAALAQAPSSGVTQMLAALDDAKLYDEAPNLDAMSATDRAALGAILVTRIAQPHGTQGGLGRQIAYLQAARAVPNGAEVALAFLRRPPPRRIVADTSGAYSEALLTLAMHEADGSAMTAAACTQLAALLAHPPAALVRGGTPALQLDLVAYSASACLAPPLADIQRVCNGTVGTYCDAARLRAGDPVRTREMVTAGLGMPTDLPPGAAQAHWGQLARAFDRAGASSPIAALLPLLDSTVVLHVPTMITTPSHGPCVTQYADVGVADMYVGLAVSVWHLPVHFAPTPPGAMVERVYTAAERAEVRRLVLAHPH